ncbi:MAG TPA: sodium-dependent transporter [Phycisphaerae bacterium]|nr:sodium-dependent transporter [Phycisphaerae bacterium]
MSVSREQWGSRLGVILAVAGSAVGLGNFLRFPGQAASNGGGSFMIPYFCALLCLGIPICWAEWTMGKYAGRHGFHSCPAVFGLLGRHPAWRYLGVLGLLIPIVIYTYYVLIESWCLGYAWCYLVGSLDLGDDPTRYAERSSAFFNNFVGAEQDGLVLDGRLHVSVVFWLIVFAVNFLVIFRGLSKGIERFCTIAVPLMALCAFLVLIRVLTLGTPDPGRPELNVLNGLGFMWNPKPMDGAETWYAALARPQVWLNAAGQIFFSLSVGFGVIVNYASYLRSRDDVVLSGLTASATNEFFEVCLGGLITIPAAFVFLGVVGAATTGTFDLGFKTLPIVFEYMPGGRFFGFLWFFMLFLAAITSSLSMLQPAIAFLEEALGIGRRASVALLGLLTLLGSLFVVYYSKGLTALGVLDDWVGTVVIVVLATVQVILFAWVFGARRGRQFAEQDSEIRLPRLFVFLIKYVAPVYLLFVLGSWCYADLPRKLAQLGSDRVAFLSICLVLAIMAFLLVLIYVGGRRWNVERLGARLASEPVTRDPKETS